MWTCSKGRAIVLRAIAPAKGRRGDWDEWVLQSSTLWLQLCTTHLLYWDPWDRTEMWAEGREEQSASTLWCSRGRPQGLPSCPGAQSRAGCSSTTGLLPGLGDLSSVLWNIWTRWHWGARLLSQHQGVWVLVLLISKISPDSKAFSVAAEIYSL